MQYCEPARASRARGRGQPGRRSPAAESVVVGGRALPSTDLLPILRRLSFLLHRVSDVVRRFEEPGVRAREWGRTGQESRSRRRKVTRARRLTLPLAAGFLAEAAAARCAAVAFANGVGGLVVKRKGSASSASSAPSGSTRAVEYAGGGLWTRAARSAAARGCGQDESAGENDALLTRERVRLGRGQTMKPRRGAGADWLALLALAEGALAPAWELEAVGSRSIRGRLLPARGGCMERPPLSSSPWSSS